MKYVTFVGTEGAMPEAALTIMNREFPAYLAEMEPRAVRLYGRELDFPQSAVTVRVRDGKPLVTDGPFAETKEFVGGIDLLECSDLDEAIEVQSKNPVAWFLPLEIRPMIGAMRVGPAASAFEQRNDEAGVPYLLMWIAATPDESGGDQLSESYEAWREPLMADGSFVLGSAIGGPETATTLRFHDGEMRLVDGPFLEAEASIVGIDVVICADRQRAIELATAHPFAREHAIEARPFHSE